MTALITNPAFHEFFRSLGLREAADFLNLPGIIVSGHSNRNVARVQLECGCEKVTAFLKREHRVLRRQRLSNSLKGFGYVSNSMREAQTLRALGENGIGCPSVLAAGEDDRGRAFLLVQESSGFVELRAFLKDGQADARTRRRFARRLGEFLGKIHNAGFDHPDLYSKHILVQPDTLEIQILDWQRSRRCRRVNDRVRWQNLAALEATVANELATNRDRLRVLKAYMHRARPYLDVQDINAAARMITRYAHKLRRRRPRLEELRRIDTAHEPQKLIWLDGEALCVTPDFYERLKGQLPGWLLKWASSAPCAKTVVAVDGSPAELVSRCESRPIHHWWCRLRGTRPTAPETHHAGLIFRLQRFGISAPRLLAFGQRQAFPSRALSFLLTQADYHPGIALSAWMKPEHQTNLWTAERKERWEVIRATAKTLRQLHEAGLCLVRLHAAAELPFSVFRNSSNQLVVGLSDIRALRRFRGTRRHAAARELIALKVHAEACGLSRSDMLRFLLTYLERRSVDAKVRDVVAYDRSHWSMRRLLAARG